MTNNHENENTEDQNPTTEIPPTEAPTAQFPAENSLPPVPPLAAPPVAEGKPTRSIPSFFKQRWVKIVGGVVVGLLILGIGVGIGAEISDEHSNGGHSDRNHSQVEERHQKSERATKGERGKTSSNKGGPAADSDPQSASPELSQSGAGSNKQ